MIALTRRLKSISRLWQFERPDCVITIEVRQRLAFVSLACLLAWLIIVVGIEIRRAHFRGRRLHPSLSR